MSRPTLRNVDAVPSRQLPARELPAYKLPGHLRARALPARKPPPPTRPLPARELPPPERHPRPSAARWLAPTLLGPWLAVHVTIALLGPLGFAGKTFVDHVVGSVWAVMYGAMLVFADVALLGAKARALPTGVRAWAASTLSPLAVFGAYFVAPPNHADGYVPPVNIVTFLLLPMVVVALATRLLGEEKRGPG